MMLVAVACVTGCVSALLMAVYVPSSLFTSLLSVFTSSFMSRSFFRRRTCKSWQPCGSPFDEPMFGLRALALPQHSHVE